jgi:hypothetical protein
MLTLVHCEMFVCFQIVGRCAWNPSTDDETLINGDMHDYLNLIEKYGELAVHERLRFLSSRFEDGSQLNHETGDVFETS